MGDLGIVVIALFVFAAVTIAKGVRIVAQGEEWIVERLGKYHTTLLPGLNVIIPYLDQVRYKLVTKDIILDVQEQEVITKDNAVIITNAIEPRLYGSSTGLSALAVLVAAMRKACMSPLVFVDPPVTCPLVLMA